MLRFLADENLNNGIVRGIRRRLPEADIVRVQDIGLSGASDEEVLEWCGRESCILLTHDAATVPEAAMSRLAQGAPLPGVLIIRRSLALGAAIDDMLLIIVAGTPDDWEGKVRYLPL